MAFGVLCIQPQTPVLSMTVLKPAGVSQCSLISSPQCIFQLPPNNRAGFLFTCVICLHEDKSPMHSTSTSPSVQRI